MPPATPRLTIIADDLTGAADSAARCKHAGLDAAIVLDAAYASQPRNGAVAISTDSRHLPAAEAAAIVGRVATRLAAQGEQIWYKKIDSTLRGNLGAEIDAMMAACNIRHAIVSPGFPAQHRGLRNGHLVHDDRESVDLVALLSNQSRHPIHLIVLDTVRQGIDAVARQLALLQPQSALIVADALTEADLDTLLAAQRHALPAALLCGSAGLVGEAARVVGGGSETDDRRPTTDNLGSEGVADDSHPSPPGPTNEAADKENDGKTVVGSRSSANQPPTIIVAGSGSPMAHTQLAALRAREPATFHEVTPDGIRVFGEYAAAYHAIHQPRPTACAILDGAGARRRAAHLADYAQRLIGVCKPSTVILVGGDTAIGVLDRLGVQELRVERELLPGMPLTTPIPAPDSVDSIVLKAGNHGTEETLLSLLELLRMS